MRVTKQELERFNSKWTSDNSKDACHLWLGPLDKDGYGTFYFRKRGRRAHRVAYYIAVGDIADGMVIDHICKNRHCVNISHLRMITIRENTLTNSRAITAINAMKTQCKNGHPFDKKYGKQRYCSVCERAKTRRLHKKWAAEVALTKC